MVRMTYGFFIIISFDASDWPKFHVPPVRRTNRWPQTIHKECMKSHSHKYRGNQTTGDAFHVHSSKCPAASTQTPNFSLFQSHITITFVAMPDFFISSLSTFVVVLMGFFLFFPTPLTQKCTQQSSLKSQLLRQLTCASVLGSSVCLCSDFEDCHPFLKQLYGIFTTIMNIGCSCISSFNSLSSDLQQYCLYVTYVKFTGPNFLLCHAGGQSRSLFLILWVTTSSWRGI